MSGERVERRLAAILVANVAGYSRPMERDEEGTLARLRAIRRELADSQILSRSPVAAAPTRVLGLAGKSGDVCRLAGVPEE